MSFDGDLYPEAGATSVMTTKGDMVDFDTQRQRLGIGSASQVLQVTAGGLPAWQTLAAGGGDFEKIAQTVLGSAGTSLKIAGQSINLDPTATPTYSQLYVVGNLLWDDTTTPTSVVVTGTINDGTSHTGCTLKIAATPTGAVFTNTATIPISMALGRTVSPSFFMWIGVGYESEGNQSLLYNWHYTGNDDTQVMGGGRLETTASSTFTDIDLIGSNNFDEDSTLTLYGVKA